MICPIISYFTVGVFALLFLQYGLRLIITYPITQERIEVKYFGFVSWVNIPFFEIAEIYKESGSKTLLVFPYTGWLGNNRLWAKYVVVIKTKDSTFPTAVLTPDNPDEFVQTVKMRIEVIQKRERY